MVAGAEQRERPVGTITARDEHPASARRRRIVLSAALVLAGCAVFYPTLRHDFVNYDDNYQIQANELIRNLSPPALLRMFSRFSYTSYYPIRLLSFAVNYAVSGLEPWSYHLANMLLHCTNGVLLFLLIARLLGRRAREASAWPVLGAAGLGAALFVLHPVVVEPVAWVAGREELLTVFFGLLCLRMHMGAADRDAASFFRRPRPGAVVACACACMSNVVGAVLPVLLTGYDLCLWPEPRTRWGKRLAVALRRTWPMWLFAIVTVALKLAGDARPSIDFLRVLPRLEGAARVRTVLANYAFNLGTLVWPARLVTPYANMVPGRWLLGSVLAGAGLVAATGAGLWAARRDRVLLFGGIWFLIALAPSSQLVPHHIFRADRFLYLPLAGLSTAVAAGLACALSSRRARALAAVGTALVLPALGIRSIRQVRVWRDSVTLFEHTLSVDPLNSLARLNLGCALTAADQDERAVAHLRELVRQQPELADGHYNLGAALEHSDSFEQALQHYSEAVRLRPGHVKGLVSLGALLTKQGDAAAAVAHLSAACRKKPDFAVTHNNLGITLGKLGRRAEAYSHFSEAIRLKPEYADPYYNFGLALGREGKFEEAVGWFERAARLAPGNEAYAQALAGAGQLVRETREHGGKAR